MQFIGVIRRIDELGRVVIPVELRKNLNIADGDQLQIYVKDGKIILEKCYPADIFDGSEEDLIDYCGKKVSRHSIIEMAKLIGLDVKEN